MKTDFVKDVDRKTGGILASFGSAPVWILKRSLRPRRKSEGRPFADHVSTSGRHVSKRIDCAGSEERLGIGAFRRLGAMAA